jgi:multiple sugar transport system permease protein
MERAASRTMWQRSRETRVAYAFLLPVLSLFLIFRIGPALASFLLSFLKYRIAGNSSFIGLANYRRLLDDGNFWQSLKVTTIYTAIAVPLVIVLALAMALLVNRALRGMSFFRALYFLPYITSMVMVGVIWKWIYKADDGLLNSFLGLFHAPRIPWLEEDYLVLFSLAIMSVWKGVGYAMMILLAGLRAIPQSYQEAAAIDGATAWQRFIKITLPLLKPVLFFVLVIETIGSFQVFDAIYVMTGGGPVRASYSLVYMLYDQGFKYSDFGYASAIGVVLFVIVLGLALGQRTILGRSDT